MANPRAKVLFNEVQVERVSFQADGVSIVYDGTQQNGIAAAVANATAGKPAVAVSASKVVRLAQAGDRIIGTLYAVEAPVGGITVAIVEVGGFIQMRANPAVAAGDRVVGAVNGAVQGYVRTAAPPGAAYAQAAATDAWAQRGTVVDVTDPLNPWVYME